MSIYTITTGSPVPTLTGASTKTLILLNPNVTFRVNEIGVSFDGSAAAQAIRVDLYRTLTLGTPAGTTGSPYKYSESEGPSPQCTSLVNLTTEPTAVKVLKSWFVSPAGGLLVIPFPQPGGLGMSGTSNDNLGLRVTTPASVTPSAAAYIEWNE